MMFLGGYVNNFVKINSIYLVTQEYFHNQYQTRTRDIITAINDPNKEKTEADEIKEAVQEEMELRQQQLDQQKAEKQKIIAALESSHEKTVVDEFGSHIEEDRESFVSSRTQKDMER